MNDYEGVRRVTYGRHRATFVPVCRACGRFVRPRRRVVFDLDGHPVGWTGTCKRCGRIKMIFEGYM